MIRTERETHSVRKERVVDRSRFVGFERAQQAFAADAVEGGHVRIKSGDRLAAFLVGGE
jgi:hypothetical protein